jgi:hypothetical protein
VDGTFKEALFETYLLHKQIPWPRLDSGRLALDRDTFGNMSKRYPAVQPLHELRKTLDDLKLNKLAVGQDRRNRTILSPFACKDGTQSAEYNQICVWASEMGSRINQARRGNGIGLLRLVVTRNCDRRRSFGRRITLDRI